MYNQNGSSRKMAAMHTECAKTLRHVVCVTFAAPAGDRMIARQII
jgi:hypothetical protein